MRAAALTPAVALYVGGFEAIGGIEACFQDLAIALAKQPVDLALFAWATDLSQLQTIAQSGVTVYRSGLRRGSQWRVPDQALFWRHGAKLKDMDTIVLGKFPPPATLRRMRAIGGRNRSRRAEVQYITAYRPSEMWGATLPGFIADCVDTMIVQSPDFTADLRAMGFAGRIVEVPYLPPMAPITPAYEPPADRMCRLGFLGRFVPQKNLFYLLDIIAALLGTKIELHMFGEGEHDVRLRSDVAARGLPVIFHGAVPREAVADAIDSCDIFLNPSVSEGQCLVALEVLSRGRPFLASAVGAIPQILARGRFGAVLPLDDPAAAAAVINQTIGEWRAGAWVPAAVADDYRRSYRTDHILQTYFDLFTGVGRADGAASAS
ncbi:glycosyltransferase family 4 protein [Sphingomonas sp. MMS24-J45]|uniref:glycosyltransferase family 4 protein n=1 Tax=Sphingomonas sp. MMS24-J45 TaxID=3238806 RepID=UPI00384DCA08